MVWEVAIKRRLGKLDAPADLLVRLEQADVGLLSISARHADRVGTLPMHYRDPLDRLLIAQADTEGLTLVSANAAMRRYGVEVVWERPNELNSWSKPEDAAAIRVSGRGEFIIPCNVGRSLSRSGLRERPGN